MTDLWFRHYVDFTEHPKVLALGRRDRAEIMWEVWMPCAEWTRRHGDGWVPVDIVVRYDPKLRAARRLVEVGLWHAGQRDGQPGYYFHDWSERQPSAEEIKARRERNRQRQKRWRDRQRDDDRGIDGGDSRNGPRNALRNALRDASRNRLLTPGELEEEPPLRGGGSSDLRTSLTLVGSEQDDPPPEGRIVPHQHNPRANNGEGCCRLPSQNRVHRTVS